MPPCSTPWCMVSIPAPQCDGESHWKRIENAEYPEWRRSVAAEKSLGMSVNMLSMLCIRLAYRGVHLWLVFKYHR